MRNNQPVTQREFRIPENSTLMSTTDSHGKITYANDAFIAVSGFERDELTDCPHNIVRHPDMPAEAFADMWNTLKSGRPWTALVKNRRKNGDHYWVRANATPVKRNGKTDGYMSVRTSVSTEEIARAEALYAKIRAGQGHAIALREGVLVQKGWRSIFSLYKTMSVRSRIRLVLACIAPFPIIVDALVSGFSGTALWTSIATLLGSLVLIDWILGQQIAKPLEKMLDNALKVASMESNSTPHLDRINEIGMTNRCIGQLGLMFRWVVADVGTQVKSVQTGVAEIAQGNDDLSARTEQAASSVQQTASSLSEINATVQSNVATATHATDLSSSASDAATQGGKAVFEVVNTMNAIADSSKKISDIIGVIDGIAFQTNILALNAAVEAARAGDQGRGFAVVASEVRSLAKRSADAAKEIKGLIGNSSEKVGMGTSLVNVAGQSMGDILSRIQNVSQLINEISHATTEQASGIEQVGQAINELDRITQQNAALCEQTSAASGSLRQQTNRLADAVQVFIK